MADVDAIFKALRLIPDFDGNPHILPRFINLCDHIVSEYCVLNPGNALARLCLVNGILNKITGPAARIINSNGISEDWDCIKTALINNFSDQRDETALYNDLMLAIQGNKSPQEFYDHCMNLFSTIMTYVTLHESIDTTIAAKRSLYRKLTMQAFVRGLKEPLGSRIRCMRPESVEKALEFVQEELNVMYLQTRNESADKKPHIPQIPKPLHTGHIGTQPYKPFNFPVQVPHASNIKYAQQYGKPYQFNQPNPSFKPMGTPTYTQQMFRAPPPNYNAHQNQFQVNSRTNHQIGPRPMSGVSRYVARERPSFGQPGVRDWRTHGNPPPSNYFKTREMNINECANYNDYYYPIDNHSFNEPENYNNMYPEQAEYYNTDSFYYMASEI